MIFFKKIWKQIRNNRQGLNDLEGATSRIFERIRVLEDHNRFVACETCGCAVVTEKAIRGKSEVRKRYPDRLSSSGWGMTILSYPPTEDYIYTPHYCRACAPKDAGDRVKIGKGAPKLSKKGKK